MAPAIKLADLPASKDYMNDFVEIVFSPLFNGSSNAVLTIPKAGINSFIKYSIEYHEQINRNFSNKFSKFMFIHIELEKAGSIEEIYRNILSQLSGYEYREFISESSTIQEIKSFVKNLAAEGKALCIVCNNAEVLLRNESIFSKLLSIYSIDNGVIRLLLLFAIEIDETDLLKFLTPIGIQIIKTAPLRNSSDMEVLLAKEERWYKYKLGLNFKEKIISKSGGYSALARGLLALAHDEPKAFIKYSDIELANLPVIQSWLWKLYSVLSEESKLQLMQSLLPDVDVSFSKYLLKTKIIKIVKSKFQYFSPLFKPFLEEISHSSERFKNINNKIYLYNIPIDDLFSPQEFSVFKLLWDNKGKIVSRNEIASALWGAKANEKYSDWSIDKIISRIRIKIGGRTQKYIETHLGKGFKMN